MSSKQMIKRKENKNDYMSVNKRIRIKKNSMYKINEIISKENQPIDDRKMNKENENSFERPEKKNYQSQNENKQ